MFLFSELPRACDVFQLFVVGVLHTLQLIGCLLVPIVQVLHCVYYLPQLHCQLLLTHCDGVELLDLLLILNVDSFLM